MNAIDWSIFDKWSENTVYCRCGAVYRSHTKMTTGDDGALHLHCRKPCPACGKSIDNHWKVSSDVEVMSIGKKDT